MPSQLPSVLTTVGLNLLRKIGVQTSVFFSPIEVSLSFINSSLESNELLPTDIFQVNSDFDEGDFKEKLEMLESDLEEKNLSTTTGRYPFSVHRKKQFGIDKDIIKQLEFISMEADKNCQISCDQEENMSTEDEDFKVLSIPMAENSLSFVIFLPKEDKSLSESLEKLETEAFQSLLHDLSFMYIDFQIPVFKVPKTSETLTYSSRIFNFQEFELTDKAVEDIGKCRIIPRNSTGIMQAACETIPLPFLVDHPFFFAVMTENIPLILGIFNGK
ncbi:hypothetical protein CRE_28616 [Caenorhabditis remanei]|uniref:Serpin domain-containing protein n=1 Tax=Caenorhabditis remanei TaxID=31234 RepID=E3LN99_CAERE|nr:hypothetical protein CRE_28616 [Caenorhabditis remanei]